MKQAMRFSLMVAVTIVLFSSCSKKGSGDAKYIPKDAAMVISFNLGAMDDTLKKAGMGFDSLFAKMAPKDSAGQSEVQQIKNAGFDWKKPVHIFTMQYNTVKGNVAVMNMLGSLTDTAKFVAFIKGQKNSDEIVREQNFSYSVMGNNVLGWNGSNLILSTYQVKSNMDSIGMIDAPQDMSKYRGDMISEIKKYFTQEASASLTEVEAFTDLAKQNAHGFSWVNMQSMTQLPGGMQFPQLTELLKDSYAASTFNFERGKIVSDTKMYFSKAMQSILDKNEMPAADLSLVDRYPSKNINGFYLFGLNPQAINAVLKEAQLDALANTALSKEGFQLQDIINALQGQVAFIVSDIGTAPAAATGEPKFANWLVNVTIKDKAALDKIINSGVQKGLLVRQGDYLLFNSPAGGPQTVTQKIKLTATNLFVGSDSALIESYIANTGGGSLNADLKKRFDGKSAAGYFNFNSLNINMGGGASQNNPMAMMLSMVTMFTGQFIEAVVTLDKYDDGKMSGHSELTLKDNSQNSMVVITKMFSDIAAMAMQMGMRGNMAGEGDMPSEADWKNATDSVSEPAEADNK